MSNQCAKKVAGDNRNANLKSFLTDSEDNETPDRFWKNLEPKYSLISNEENRAEVPRVQISQLQAVCPFGSIQIKPGGAWWGFFIIILIVIYFNVY